MIFNGENPQKYGDESLTGKFFPDAWQGFPFHSWGLGVEAVFARRCATVRNRSQPFATVARMAVPGGFKCHVASFRVAGVALRDIQTCFVTCGKSFCVAGAMLLRSFQKMRSIFCGRRNTLETIIVILRGRRSTLDVSCGSFFANRIVRAA